MIASHHHTSGGSSGGSDFTVISKPVFTLGLGALIGWLVGAAFHAGVIGLCTGIGLAVVALFTLHKLGRL